MTHSTLSTLTSNIADETSHREALADVLAWLADDPTNDVDGYAPGWQDDDYQPSESDWQEYSTWSRGLDGGCGVSELSPEERDLITHSSTEEDYWDAVAESDSIHADRQAEFWS